MKTIRELIWAWRIRRAWQRTKPDADAYYSEIGYLIATGRLPKGILQTLAAIVAIALAGLQAGAQTIVAQYPVRQFGPWLVVPVCVRTPIVPVTYQIQVSTDNGATWATRLGVTERNAGTNCWNVRLQASETNHFTVRIIP